MTLYTRHGITTDSDPNEVQGHEPLEYSEGLTEAVAPPTLPSSKTTVEADLSRVESDVLKSKCQPQQ